MTLPLNVNFPPLWHAAMAYCEHEDKSIRRLLHGRGGCYAGLEQVALDGFERYLLCTVFKTPAVELLAELEAIAQAVHEKAHTLIVQRRDLPGTPYEALFGAVPQQLIVSQQGLRYPIKFNVQNTGLFLDMATARSWLAERAEGKNVLNLFAYTCAFSVVAMRNGARACTNVDMSKSALSWGREAHRINQLATGNVNFLGLNILKSWSRIKKPGPYEVIIVDPPSFQKGSFVATKDYLKLVRRLPELAAPQCDVLLCLNAPEVGERFVHDLCDQYWPQGQFIGRLALPSVFKDIDPDRQLKLLHYRH